MNDVELERLLEFNVDQAHKLTIKCEEENASLMEKVKNLKNKLDKPRYLKKFSKWIFFFFQMLSFQISSCDRSGLWYIKMGSIVPYSHLHHSPLLVMKENNLCLPSILEKYNVFNTLGIISGQMYLSYFMSSLVLKLNSL